MTHAVREPRDTLRTVADNATRLVISLGGGYVLVQVITVLTALQGRGKPYGGPISVGQTGFGLSLVGSDAYPTTFSLEIYLLDIAITASMFYALSFAVRLGGVVLAIAGSLATIALLIVVGTLMPAPPPDRPAGPIPAGLGFWLYAVAGETIVGLLWHFLRRRRSKTA